MNDVIEGQAGPDLVFGDHAFITFDDTVSHKLKYARTTNHSCSGGDDFIDLGDGDVSTMQERPFLLGMHKGPKLFYKDLTLNLRCALCF